jgi:hypothetical protein
MGPPAGRNQGRSTPAGQMALVPDPLNQGAVDGLGLFNG